MRRHHKLDQIIGDAKSSVMTRRKIKGYTCLLCEFEHKSIKYALDNEDWIHCQDLKTKMSLGQSGFSGISSMKMVK